MHQQLPTTKIIPGDHRPSSTTQPLTTSTALRLLLPPLMLWNISATLSFPLTRDLSGLSAESYLAAGVEYNDIPIYRLEFLNTRRAYQARVLNWCGQHPSTKRGISSTSNRGPFCTSNSVLQPHTLPASTAARLDVPQHWWVFFDQSVCLWINSTPTRRECSPWLFCLTLSPRSYHTCFTIGMEASFERNEILPGN